MTSKSGERKTPSALQQSSSVAPRGFCGPAELQIHLSRETGTVDFCMHTLKGSPLHHANQFCSSQWYILPRLHIWKPITYATLGSATTNNSLGLQDYSRLNKFSAGGHISMSVSMDLGQLAIEREMHLAWTKTETLASRHPGYSLPQSSHWNPDRGSNRFTHTMHLSLILARVRGKSTRARLEATESVSPS